MPIYPNLEIFAKQNEEKFEVIKNIKNKEEALKEIKRLTELASDLTDKGLFEKTIIKLEKILELEKKYLGANHPDVGGTLSKIAYEKAGIIKKEVPVIIGETNIETKPVFKKKAKDLNAKIFFVKDSKKNYRSDLLGIYQKKNIDTSILAIKKLKNFIISQIEIETALLNIKKTTKFFGRWDVVSKKPKIIIDVSHNLKGFQTIIDQLVNENFEDLHLVLGFLKGKDVN